MSINFENTDDFDLEMEEILRTSRVNQELAMQNQSNVNFQIEAIRNGNHDVMYKILKLPDRNIDIKNNEYITPLMAAFESGEYFLAKSLIEDGADILATDNDGRTPISYAMRNGHWSCVELFRNFLEINMIEYNFSEEHSDYLSDRINNRTLPNAPVGMFAPLSYSYNIEVTLRSGKRLTAAIVSKRTFTSLVEYLEWMAVHEKEEFYTGPDFAFRPKDVASITLN